MTPAAATGGWDAFARLPRAARLGLVAAALLAVVELAGALVEPLGAGGDAGPAPSSVSSTAGDGLAAYAELLASAGHEVDVRAGGGGLAALGGDKTVVVAGGAPGAIDAEALAAFVERGGRLVVLGESPVLPAVAGRGVRWESTPGGSARPAAAVAEVRGVRRVQSPGPGSWTETGPALPVLIGPRRDAVVAAVVVSGRGRVVLVASASVLHNENLAAADNAAFGLNAAGGPERGVVFYEPGRAGGERGLAALPDRWKTALVALSAAVVLGLWSAGRRFGPPEAGARDLPPPRRVYVDALAATLAKTNDTDAALAPLRAAAMERLRQRAGLGPNVDAAGLRRAAAERGLAADEEAALFGPVQSSEQAMALGRAMVRLGRIESKETA